MIDVRIQGADFEPGRQLVRLEELGSPALASFTALSGADSLIDHYPALARNELAAVAAEAGERWSLSGLILIHRFGRLAAGERLAFAAVAAEEIDAAHAACAFLTEALRTRAPFWRLAPRDDADSSGR